MNEFTPPVEEQAREIYDLLVQRDDVDLAEEIKPSDLERAIDGTKPVSVNLKTVLDGLSEGLMFEQP